MKKRISILLCLVIALSCFGVFGTGLVEAAGVSKKLSEELEGYTRVLLSDFKTSAGNALLISAAPAGTEVSNTASSRFYGTVGVEGADSYVLDKTYLDFDVNLASSTNAPSIMLYESADWKDYLRLKFDNTKGTMSVAYISSYTGSTVTRFNTSFNLTDFGRTSADEFFNVKIRADFAPNSTDPTKRDATFQLWINDMFALEESLTGENMRNGLFIRPGGETIYLRERKDMAKELAGYKRIDMYDFNKTVTDGVVALAVNEHATPYITDFNKTYLDVDLNFNGNTTWGSHMLQYQGSAKYKTAFYLGFVNGSDTFRFTCYKNESSTIGTKYDFNASDYGITPDDYFNIKLRTDITHVSSTVDSVLAQLWLNNTFACEVTMEFTYSTAGVHDKSYLGTAGAAIHVRSSLALADQLAGYHRVTADDFVQLEGTGLETGRDFSVAKSGEYTSDPADLAKSYFDIDIKTPNNMKPFLIWLSKNKSTTTFYGDGYQLRFYLSTSQDVTTLKMMKVAGGKNAGTVSLGNISAAPYSYSPDAFFNLKIKTTVYGSNSVGLLVFVNNTFLKNVYITDYDAETLADMTCAGIRGDRDQTGITYARTPSLALETEISFPEFDENEHIKTVQDMDITQIGQMSTVDCYVEDKDSPVTTQYTVAISGTPAPGSCAIVGLAETRANGESCFYGMELLPQDGWCIGLFSESGSKISDCVALQGYPEEVNTAGFTVTAKTENGVLSVWIGNNLVLREYGSEAYPVTGPRITAYRSDASFALTARAWCDTENYNLLGDLNGDITVDILDLIRMKKIASNTEGVSAVNDAVKALNDDGTIGSAELVLMTGYLLGNSALIGSSEIRLIAPRRGTLTAMASTAVRTVATDYDLTENRAEPFRVLHKDQYHRTVTTLSWRGLADGTEYTVLLGTNAALTDAVTYTAQKSKLDLINLLPGTTYYWKVTTPYAESGVLSFVTENTVRTLTVNGVSNTRDMGGYETEDHRTIRYGQVFRGGKVDGLDAAAKSILLDDLQIETDLDLRGYGGESPLGNTVNYYSYSAPYYWNDTRGVNATGDYRTALVNSIRVFANPANYPIYVHCSLGRDRTGTLCMLISGLCGVTKDDIYLDYELSLLSELGSTNDNLTTASLVSNHFTQLYNGIQSYATEGSFADACEAFMLSIGITQTEINTIRTMLIESNG